ncbi:DUF3416 domain-containing protein [Actinospica sp. MGRD01-02]|uniref:Alpha-1,4-glucan:maltose-1-phosphate maltosyltransferase n=1 Tax=Actinospica acidithermotolerans TaxID=2828514 RepID=A0A941IKX5_9ACTN|nr:maltotransferase domain-containing protein [Actinospica acidithermotolerans]MBR7831089.1 DUF3416 domain-containing protein [Actinospica acidithermotolerans]
MNARIIIEEISPVVDAGRYPAKAATDEDVEFGATIWTEGRATVAAAVLWRPEGGDERARTVPMRPADPGADRFAAHAAAERVGPWAFRVDAWIDPWAGWTADVAAKLADGWDAPRLANDLESGARLLERCARRASAQRAASLLEAVARLRDTRLELTERLSGALSERVRAAVADNPLRDGLTRSRWHRIGVERPLARAGAWYEFFPRSTGGRDADGRPVHGTFATAAAQLPRIADLGFDVVYLPPIHPIGSTARKGPDNSLTAGALDVGSPWAIGSADGGHDAVHPGLGTVADFERFVAEARRLGLEVALDLAFQCSPDHPWVTEHPEFFTERPDGSIAFAENPPKQYQDIYPLDFERGGTALYAELLRVVLCWIGRGVRIFRVDNPHTKPVGFWERLLADVRAQYPDTIFLSEAFTRPAVLKGLAKAGFSQSYTYFTWRTGKEELGEYLTELAADRHFLRPNFFVTTPDILPVQLHSGDPRLFAVRAALAALLGPSWGVYSGFELCEHQPLEPGSEEYRSSEKYELRPREWTGSAPERDLQPWIRELNRLRRRHPALLSLRTLRFHPVDDERLLAFSKHDERTGETVFVLVTLSPDRVAEAELTLRPDLPGLEADGTVDARDARTGEPVRLSGGTVKIDPARGVARVLTWTARRG